jgi:ABC-type lipoprotein export system ATPase subunit
MDELLALRAVQKSYRRGERRLRVLADVSLTVAVGEIVAVVGSRYEGKSTLLKIAAGLEQPDAGEVLFGGRELGSMRMSERERLLRHGIAWVHREGTGLEFEVLDYVGLPLRMGRRRSRDVQERAMAALERAGVQHVARRRWDELSNWERVLVAFARGIACEPRLMIVDDVIDGLGMSKTREAGDLLCSLVQDLGCGVLMSVSDPEAALAADRVWSFDRGALKLLSDQTADQSNIIDFPGGSVPQSRGLSGSGL